MNLITFFLPLLILISFHPASSSDSDWNVSVGTGSDSQRSQFNLNDVKVHVLRRSLSDGSGSDGAASEGDSLGSARGRSISRSRSPVRSRSSASSLSHSGTEGSLTPIDLTDDAASDHNRKVAPGTASYHDNMYGFYNAKKGYHSAIGNAYKTARVSTNEQGQQYYLQAKKHYAESESSQKKKFKHKKYFNGIVQGNLETGYAKDSHNSITVGRYPKVPSKAEATRMVQNPNIKFNKHKGHFHLVAEPVRARNNDGQSRRSRASSARREPVIRTPEESEHSSDGNGSGSRSNHNNGGHSSDNSSGYRSQPTAGTRRRRRS